VDVIGTARFREGLVRLIPSLLAYAPVLTGRRDLAEDLFQDTFVRALAAQSKYENGTNPEGVGVHNHAQSASLEYAQRSSTPLPL
jgi:Sigma-70 region 2